jgi:hypothetical protein
MSGFVSELLGDLGVDWVFGGLVRLAKRIHQAIGM